MKIASIHINQQDKKETIINNEGQEDRENYQK